MDTANSPKRTHTFIYGVYHLHIFKISILFSRYGHNVLRRDRRCRDRMVAGFTATCVIQPHSHRVVPDTTLRDKVCQ